MIKTMPMLGITAAALIVLSGCGGSTSSETESAAANGCPLTVSDSWVKAAESGMTAAFGQVANTSGSPVTITAAQTPAAGMTELHETTMVDGSMKMQQVSGFEVPADGELVLEPGGNHIMLMNIPAPIVAGEDVEITLTCADAGETSFVAQARTFDGANEDYEPGAEEPSMESGMDMSGM